MFETMAVQTTRRMEMIDITDRVTDVLRDNDVDEGLVVCYVPHTTAGVTIQENADPDVVHDMLYKLEALIPKDDPRFRHNEGNSDSHIKTSLVGPSVAIPVHAGAMTLGTWQAIYFCEFDGPRSRKLHLKLIKG